METASNSTHSMQVFNVIAYGPLHLLELPTQKSEILDFQTWEFFSGLFKTKPEHEE